MPIENTKSVLAGIVLVSVSVCQIRELNCHIGLPSVTQMSQLSYSSVTLLMKRVSKCFIFSRWDFKKVCIRNAAYGNVS